MSYNKTKLFIYFTENVRLQKKWIWSEMCEWWVFLSLRDIAILPGPKYFHNLESQWTILSCIGNCGNCDTLPLVLFRIKQIDQYEKTQSESRMNCEMPEYKLLLPTSRLAESEAYIIALAVLLNCSAAYCNLWISFVWPLLQF